MSQIDPTNSGYDFSHYENDTCLLKDKAPSIAQQLGKEEQIGQQ